MKLILVGTSTALSDITDAAMTAHLDADYSDNTIIIRNRNTAIEWKGVAPASIHNTTETYRYAAPSPTPYDGALGFMILPGKTQRIFLSRGISGGVLGTIRRKDCVGDVN